ncbi:MAG TPA: hypothetical protein VEL76_37710 [Gemmataceae bacterium]|nr:hypothetical protein [Gemmataceae bacterium]
MLSRCAILAERDDALDVAARTALAKEYADQAVHALRSALRLGATDIEELKGPRFAALHAREDFQGLLRQAEAKPPSH